MCLQITYHANILHLNEVALYEDYDPRDFHPPYSLDCGSTTVGRKIGAAYINAIMKCVSSSHKLLDRLLATDHYRLSSTPSIIFVSTAYAALVLFKVFLLVMCADHPLAAVLDRKRLQIPEYLDRLRILLSNLSHNLSFQGAHKFLDMILRLEHSYKIHQDGLWPDDRDMSYDAVHPDGGTSSNTSTVLGGHTNRYQSAQSFDSFLITPSNTASGTNDPLLRARLGEQQIDEGIASGFTHGQTLSFAFQDDNGFMQDFCDLSPSWDAIMPK